MKAPRPLRKAVREEGREKAGPVRRRRKVARKKLQREGLLPMKPKPVFGAGPVASVAVLVGGGRGGPGAGPRGPR